ncbi:XdhC family protein [Kribbella sp. NBC_01245]|uniref:XdhC family protein n=1 Tax=Kribbella sp. NBC_01245 TaxID=2903578 RepID=UPI002E2E192B|nr:XdhC family protein [Kribbella sp. NBC_01245]
MTATATELAAIHAELRTPSAIALATLVAVTGSSYRRPGARLLVHSDGRTVGNLTGGCLDQEIVEAAAEVHRDQQAKVVTFDLTGDDEAILGWGMGCNGILHILIEPISPALDFLDDVVRFRRTTTVHTVIAGPPETIGRRWWAEAFVGDVAVFTEVMVPQPRVVICGAGDDVPPLARVADIQGWETFVVDERRLLLDPARFPDTTRLVRPEPGWQLIVDSESYVVVMTHNFLKDSEYLKAALATSARYIGVLGPQRRLQRLLSFLHAEGVDERLRGPAGLDLGGQGPNEIALEIAADILRTSGGRGRCPRQDHHTRSTDSQPL